MKQAKFQLMTKYISSFVENCMFQSFNFYFMKNLIIMFKQMF